ncbi:hypothetical protein [Methanococcoides sp. AM1]|uniref:hypothetical protein n=1 Tax=Methanococcoides sp. AM1 TaxID=1201011 RepID=UPI0014386181|nr:hypothetical protein [Methanococcoides sp. AM1]
MNNIQITNNSILGKTVSVNNDQHSVIRGHVGNDLNVEELELYRFMLGGLLGK